MDARLSSDRDTRDPRMEDRLRACLEMDGDPRRVLAAYYFLEIGGEIPESLLTEFWTSEDADERGFAFDYHVERFGDTLSFWEHIQGEKDPTVVEAALGRLVSTNAYRGDPRLLAQLRRTLGTREGRPMIAVDVLSRLIPEAKEAIHVHHDPEALVSAWKGWLDAHAVDLVYDAERRQFGLSESAHR